MLKYKSQKKLETTMVLPFDMAAQCLLTQSTAAVKG